MGKYSEKFENRYSELLYDIETKIASLIIRNAYLKKETFDIPSVGDGFQLDICENEKGVRYVAITNRIMYLELKKYCTFQQAINILSKLEEIVGSNDVLA